MDLQERVVGCALGLAVGDALGAPFEFLRGANIPDPIPSLELPWMHLPPGSTTDDTAMARTLMRSLAERGGFDPEDLVRRHVGWISTDPPDVGAMTGRVLRRAARGEDAAEVARAVWEQRGPDVSAGNGSVMYCAPLGVAYANRPDRSVVPEPREPSGRQPRLPIPSPEQGTGHRGVRVGVPAERDHAAELGLGGASTQQRLERDGGGEQAEPLVRPVDRPAPPDHPHEELELLTAAAIQDCGQRVLNGRLGRLATDEGGRHETDGEHRGPAPVVEVGERGGRGC